MSLSAGPACSAWLSPSKCPHLPSRPGARTGHCSTKRCSLTRGLCPSLSAGPLHAETFPSLTTQSCCCCCLNGQGALGPCPPLHMWAMPLSPPYTHSPSSTVPTSPSSRQPNPVSPAPPSHLLRMQEHFFLPLPCYLQATSMSNPFLLIWGWQVIQPCFINIRVSLLRLGQWCLWLPGLSAPWRGLLLPLQHLPADPAGQVLSS